MASAGDSHFVPSPRTSRWLAAGHAGLQAEPGKARDRRIIARGGPRRPQRRIDPWLPGLGRVTLADGEEVSLGLHTGEALWVIAARLGKATSTVSREVAGGRGERWPQRRPALATIDDTWRSSQLCQHLRAVKMASTASGRPLSSAGSGLGRGRGDWGKSYEPGDMGSVMAPQDKGHRERRTNGGGEAQVPVTEYGPGAARSPKIQYGK